MKWLKYNFQFTLSASKGEMTWTVGHWAKVNTWAFAEW